MSETVLDSDTNRPSAETSAAAKLKALGENVDRHFDIIVCGAGTSGSVIAARLAANPDVNVLLLEAGGSDELDLVMDPTNLVRTRPRRQPGYRDNAPSSTVSLIVNSSTRSFV